MQTHELSPAFQAAQWSRRLLYAATAMFVVGVVLGSFIGTEGFLIGAVLWFPLWLCSFILAFLALWRASNSETGRMARRLATETMVALAIMLVAQIIIALLTNMVNIRVGVSQ